MGSEDIKSPCPRGACGHHIDCHGILSPLCDVEGCPCGQSAVMDERARWALEGAGWVMSSEERAARGLPTRDGEGDS